MRGRVLAYGDLDGNGVISGDDGQRYPFVRGALQGGVRTITAGAEVDFQVEEGKAIGVYVVGPSASESKSRIAAALLALFLGGMGLHKFYLGKNGAGIVMLLCTLVGWIFLFIPPIVVGVIAFIEFIIYLTKTDDQFYQAYVVGDRSWF